MSNEIIQAIKDCPMVKNIPSGISLLLKELTKQDNDIDELIALLEKFPVVCVRLIMVANSAWAAPKTEITSVKRACLQLGLKMVKSISIALLVSQQFNSKNCKGFNERTFWLSSLVMADLMQSQQKQSQIDDTDAATAHLIGLIHNLGLLAIADVAPEKMSQAILLSNNTELNFSAALYKVIDISYLEATQLILSNWGIPNTISHSYYQSTCESPYMLIFIEALKHTNRLNLNVTPFKYIDDTEEDNELINSIIENSARYDELCSIYCR